jgi:FkbM family methyltransferase
LSGSDASVKLNAAGNLRLGRCRHGPMLYRLNDVYIGRSLETYGEMGELEARVLCGLVAPGDVAIEVGANIGTNAIPLAKRLGPQGRLLAFEPQRQVHQMLCANVALNGLSNVMTFWAAAGAEPGAITVPVLDYDSQNNFGGVSLGAHDKGERVPVMTIDSLRLAACRLIKIDVEGMEFEVLQGAGDTIGRLRPRLYLENDRREKSAALIAHVTALGYRCYWHLPPLYNPDNFRNHQQDIFGRIVSVNMLCLPDDDPLDVSSLRQVSGPDDDWKRPAT